MTESWARRHSANDRPRCRPSGHVGAAPPPARPPPVAVRPPGVRGGLAPGLPLRSEAPARHAVLAPGITDRPPGIAPFDLGSSSPRPTCIARPRRRACDPRREHVSCRTVQGCEHHSPAVAGARRQDPAWGFRADASGVPIFSSFCNTIASGSGTHVPSPASCK